GNRGAGGGSRLGAVGVGSVCRGVLLHSGLAVGPWCCLLLAVVAGRDFGRGCWLRGRAAGWEVVDEHVGGRRGCTRAGGCREAVDRLSGRLLRGGGRLVLGGGCVVGGADGEFG